MMGKVPGSGVAVVLNANMTCPLLIEVPRRYLLEDAFGERAP